MRAQFPDRPARHNLPGGRWQGGCHPGRRSGTPLANHQIDGFRACRGAKRGCMALLLPILAGKGAVDAHFVCEVLESAGELHGAGG